MEKLQFVDAKLHHISENVDKSERYAIDLGVRSTFARRNLPKENYHFFVSAKPWAYNLNLREAYAFLKEIEQLNPNIAVDLLEDEQIYKLNQLGFAVDFRITNCWTCSSCTDWHGRIDGYYSLKNGKRIVDWGENKTDVYVVFGFKSGQENSVVLPQWK